MGAGNADRGTGVDGLTGCDRGGEMPDRDPQEMQKLRERVECLESRMDFLFRRMGIAQPAQAPGSGESADQPPRWKPSQLVVDLVRKGDKGGAIRAFMRESGADLKDAKEFIEKL